MDNTDAEVGGRNGRRSRWITGAAVVAVAALGAGVAVAFSKNGLKLGGSAPLGSGPTPAHLASVQGHLRQQAFGPGYALHREIWIDPYLRAVRRAA